MRILLATTNFAPERGGIAVYSTGLVEELAHRGHTVDVVAGFPHYPEWRVRDRSLFSVREQGGARVRRAFHYVPQNPTLLRRSLFEANLVLAHLASLPRERPDVVVGVVPTLAGGVAAALAARVHRRPYGVVLQDVMSQAAAQVGTGRAARASALVAAVEGRVLRNAARVAVVAEGFREPLHRLGVPPEQVDRVWNWGAYRSPVASRAVMRARLGWREGERVCLYAGSMGYKHGLEVFVDAAVMLGGQNVRIVLAGDGSDRRRLERRAADLRSPVEFLPPSPPGEYEAMLEAADMLLLSQRAGVTDMSVASKVRTYRRAGVPILAALPEGSETRREFDEVDGGMCLSPEDPEGVARAVSARGDGPTRIAADSRQAEAHERGKAVDAYLRFLERIAEQG